MTPEMRLEFAKRMVDQLNELWRLDDGAANSIVYGRFDVNTALANSPDFLVGPKMIGGVAVPSLWEMGVIGMLNGILGIDRIRLACITEDEGPRQGYVRGFALVDYQEKPFVKSTLFYPSKEGLSRMGLSQR